MRKMILGGAQMGPTQKSESRESAVARMIELLREASSKGVEMLLYPELALTTFFPRWYAEDPASMDNWFERQMPNATTQPLFALAAELRIAISFGFAEITEDGHHFNTSILTDRAGSIVGKYRKIHLPGHAKPHPGTSYDHLEKRYFEPGDLGFNVWRNEGAIMGMAICNDRRWPETYRVLGLQGVELVLIGYNTPSANPFDTKVTPAQRRFHSDLVMQSGAYQNSTYVVGVAKAGVEDGHHLIGGSIIVDPFGDVLARATTEEDELITAEADFDQCTFGKTTIFDFAAHRRIEHYGLISTQTGIVAPTN